MLEFLQNLKERVSLTEDGFCGREMATSHKPLPPIPTQGGGDLYFMLEFLHHKISEAGYGFP
ncbi:hypothetical protein CH365_15980 [Leptospira neocaledonica]|uniref:Uncharacterized protein n=1 Tax=Leptospira neocaledonica TaxID=2023192 RepID=A0A2M9ZUZ0_9LEPT|nr:hypothetical protein CH365_15980 [Leptospira neocaledonica]